MSNDRYEPPALRLKDDLKWLQKELGGFKGLAERISEHAVRLGVEFFQPTEHGTVVDRRKIKALVELGEESEGRDPWAVTLSFRELCAIHEFLDSYPGLGLTKAPLLVRPPLLQAFRGAKRVVFVLGSRLTREGAHVAQADIEAMSALQRTIGTLGPIPFDSLPVLLQEDLQAAGAPDREEAWRALFADEETCVICIASPKASRASEHMLSLMLGLPAHEPAPDELPFRFVWKRDDIPSCVGVSRERVAGLPGDGAAVAASKDGGFVLDEVYHARTLKAGERGFTYAVLCVQLRGGRVWVATSGLTGAATLAAARILPSLRQNLPSAREDGTSRVLWIAVRAEVEGQQIGSEVIPRLLESVEVLRSGLW